MCSPVKKKQNAASKKTKKKKTTATVGHIHNYLVLAVIVYKINAVQFNHCSKLNTLRKLKQILYLSQDLIGQETAIPFLYLRA